MRENGLLAPPRKEHVDFYGKHDGLVIPESVNELWGVDAARFWTEEEGFLLSFYIHGSLQSRPLCESQQGTNGI